MKKHCFLLFLLTALCCTAFACAQEHSGFYQPSEYAENDYESPDARWSFARSAESDHFFVFWEAGFGADPALIPEEMRIDVTDLLAQAEKFYQTNVTTLAMADSLPGGYKLQIYLLYTEDWVATGSGFDDRIGAMWVSPMTCHPVGSVIAHEMGHCFQYLVYCQQLADGAADDHRSGFRYGYAEDAGNALWEIGAQWQSWQNYPAEQFTDYELDTWFANYHRALENEYTRYQNYWWFDYLTEHYGLDAYGRIWRESRWPEDAYTCFMRLYLNNDLNAFYAQLYDYAAHAVTFDFAAARPYAADWQGRYDATLYDVEGWQRIAYASCPEANGFAALPLDASQGSSVTVRFRGLPAASSLASQDPGRYYLGDEATAENLTGLTRTYNAMESAPGWRYGFVALRTDGTRIYSDMHDEAEGDVTFEIPADTQELYFVVLGAPATYVCHVWDNDEATDAQLPFEVQILYAE